MFSQVPLIINELLICYLFESDNVRNIHSIPEILTRFLVFQNLPLKIVYTSRTLVETSLFNDVGVPSHKSVDFDFT